MYPGYQEVEVALILNVYTPMLMCWFILEPIHLVFWINEKEISEHWKDIFLKILANMVEEKYLSNVSLSEGFNEDCEVNYWTYSILHLFADYSLLHFCERTHIVNKFYLF